jgi:hypothetical protein
LLRARLPRSLHALPACSPCDVAQNPKSHSNRQTSSTPAVQGNQYAARRYIIKKIFFATDFSTADNDAIKI